MTIQVSDQLVLAGNQFRAEFDSHLPEAHLAIRKASAEEFKAAMREADYLCSTACWRGYVATWHIAEGVLRLKSIQGAYVLCSRKPIRATWISETLAVSMGKHLFRHIHEQQLRIQVEQGSVVKATLVDNLSTCPPALYTEGRLWRLHIDRTLLKPSLDALTESLGCAINTVSAPAEWWAKRPEFAYDPDPETTQRQWRESIPRRLRKAADWPGFDILLSDADGRAGVNASETKDDDDIPF